MKLIIAGTRTLYAYPVLQEALAHFELVRKIKEVVHGGASGMDRCADRLGMDLQIYTKVFPYIASLGRAGGPARNAEMSEYGDALLVIWNGESAGSKNMKEIMIAKGKPVYEIILRKYNVPIESTI